MGVAAVGVGVLGTAVATGLARSGHDVVVTFSSDAGRVAETVAQLAPGANVLQALSTTFAQVLSERAASMPGRPTVPMCGDDAAAKRTAAEVIDALGCDPLDLGGLSKARALETFATASAQLAIASGRAPLFATRWLVPGP